MGLRFRIANWICHDYLRNYLAVGVLIPLDNLLKSNDLSNWDRKRIEKIRNCVNEIFEF